MAVEGEPLKGRHGVLLYAVQTAKGTPVTPNTAAGIASYDVTSDSGTQALFTLGQPQPLTLKPGITQVSFTITIAALQEKTLLTKVIRSSGVLPWLTLGFGYKTDGATPTQYAWQVQDCKIHRAEVALEAGGPVRVTLTGVGGLITELTTLNPANLTPEPFWSYEGVLTKAGAAYEARSVNFAIDNQVDVQSVIRGAAPASFKRGWAYQTEGNLAITGEITRFAKSGLNLQADTISDFTVALALTDIAGGMSPNSATISVTGAKFLSERIAAEIDGDILFTTPFQAKDVTIT